MDYATYITWKEVQYYYGSKIEYSKLKTGLEFIDQTWTGLD